MQFLTRIVSRNPHSTYYSSASVVVSKYLRNSRVFSSESQNGGGNEGDNNPWDKLPGETSNFGWDDVGASSWSTGLTKDFFDGQAVGHQVSPDSVSAPALAPAPAPAPAPSPSTGRASGAANDPLEESVRVKLNKLQRDARAAARFDASNMEAELYDEKTKETSVLLKQIIEPGARGSYLKDSEKSEMYRLHREDPEVYTIERLAKDYRIMRQRVAAILWLKEMEEEEEKKRGEPLDDSVELLLDTFPEFFISHDREFHVASLPYKPDFKVMPEGWDGTTRDPDEVHYEISKKEDDILYEEFMQRFNFNKMKFKNEVKVHKYSRRRPSDGWSFTVEKLGPKGKRGSSGGWKFVSQPDGSTRPLNETEKMYVKRETPRRRRKILP